MKQIVLPEKKIIQKIGTSVNTDNTELLEQINQLNSTVKEQQKELINKQDQIVILNGEITALNTLHQSEIESINQAHAEEIELLNTTHSNQISQIESEHNSEIEQLTIEHTNTINGLVNDYEDQIEGIEQGYIERDNELMVIINDINTLL